MRKSGPTSCYLDRVGLGFRSAPATLTVLFGLIVEPMLPRRRGRRPRRGAGRSRITSCAVPAVLIGPEGAPERAVEALAQSVDQSGLANDWMGPPLLHATGLRCRVCCARPCRSRSRGRDVVHAVEVAVRLLRRGLQLLCAHLLGVIAARLVPHGEGQRKVLGDTIEAFALEATGRLFQGLHLFPTNGRACR